MRTIRIFRNETLLRVVNVSKDAEIDRQWMLELHSDATHYVKE